MGLTTNAGAMKFAVNGAERMRINTTGNVGIGTATPNTNLEIYNTSPAISIKGSSEADTATLYLATPYTTASAYKCAIIAKGTSGWSRSYLHFCLNNIADNTYPAQNAGLNNIRMTIRPDGNINFYPEPFYINNTNGANYSVNLNVACNTTYTPATATFLTATVADGWNSLDTIITLACSSRANSGYYNESRMILDGSYNTNSGRGTRGSYIYWQSIDGAGNWMTNAELYTNTSPILNAVFNVNGLVKSYGVTLSSSKEIKTNLRDIYDPLDLIEKFQGKHYFNLKTNQKDFGLVAEDVEQICPCLTSRTEDTGVEIGIKYMNLTAVLVEGIKQLNGKVKTLENIIQQQSLIIQNIQAQI
jgi:hypothetical protein